MRHTQAELFQLVQMMDRFLGSPTRLGFFELPSLTLASYPGTGLDPAPGGLTEKIQTAYRLASSKSHSSIPFLSLQLQDFPMMFETRLNLVQVPSTRFITLGMIDRHDAAISHLLRNERKEIDAIKKLGHHSRLSYESLIDSFCSIDSEGRDTRRLKQGFLDLLGYLFGATSVAQAEAVLSERAPF